MKITTALFAVLLVAALAVVSITRISAQSGPQNCPGYGYGMMGGQGYGYMMGGANGKGYGYMMQGMSGPADRAYMQSFMYMHRGLYGHTFSGNPDRDFMSMMIPQHQAIMDMARTELQYGKNAKVRALAQAMIKNQQAQIDEMNALLK